MVLLLRLTLTATLLHLSFCYTIEDPMRTLNRIITRQGQSNREGRFIKLFRNFRDKYRRNDKRPPSKLDYYQAYNAEIFDNGLQAHEGHPNGVDASELACDHYGCDPYLLPNSRITFHGGKAGYGGANYSSDSSSHSGYPDSSHTTGHLVGYPSHTNQVDDDVQVGYGSDSLYYPSYHGDGYDNYDDYYRPGGYRRRGIFDRIKKWLDFDKKGEYDRPYGYTDYNYN